MAENQEVKMKVKIIEIKSEFVNNKNQKPMLQIAVEYTRDDGKIGERDCLTYDVDFKNEVGKEIELYMSEFNGKFYIKKQPYQKKGGGGGYQVNPEVKREERASIEAQTALKTAVEYCKLQIEWKRLNPEQKMSFPPWDEEADDMLKWLKSNAVVAK